MGRDDPSRRERCDSRRRALFTVQDDAMPSATDHTVPFLRRHPGYGGQDGTGFEMARSQAFHAWLPSCSPYGTNKQGSLRWRACAVGGWNSPKAHYSNTPVLQYSASQNSSRSPRTSTSTKRPVRLTEPLNYALDSRGTRSTRCRAGFNAN